VRELIRGSACLTDGKKLTEMKQPFLLKRIEKRLIEKSKGTIIYELLKENNLI